MSKKNKTKKLSMADVAEMGAKGEGPKDLSSLLESGTSDGYKQSLPFGEYPAFIPREDGRLGVITQSGNRGVSDDGGRSFKPLDAVKLPDAPKFEEPTLGGIGDSYNGVAGVVKMTSGKIGMTWTQVYPAGGDMTAVRFFFRTSDDEGETWSEDVRVNEGDDKGVSYFGTLRQLASGRLIQPVYLGFYGGNHLRKCSVSTCEGEVMDHEGHGHHPEFAMSYCYFSDDEGATWSRSLGDIIGWFQDGWGNFLPIDEPALEQLPDGRLMMVIRSLVGRILVSFSDDEGTTWGIPEVTHISADAAPMMTRRLPETGDILCVWNHQSTNEIRMGYRRCRLASAITCDGKTWKHFRSIEWHPHVPERSEYIEPEEKIQLVRALDDVGELPQGYGSSDYPTVDVYGDEVIICYGHSVGNHPKNIQYSHIHRILPVSWFYGKE